MMKRLFAVGLTVGALSLSACGQTNYAKGIYAAQTTYEVLAAPMPDVMAGKVPGVTLTDAQKSLVKASSKTVRDLLDADVAAIASGQTATYEMLTNVTTALADYEECWSLVKNGSTTCTSQSTTTSGVTK